MDGFDYSEYVKSKGIYGTIKASNITVIDKNQANYILSFSYTIKNKIKEKINLNEKNIETKSIILGILLGDTSYIDNEIIENFKDASLAHILAISGMHLMYITTFIVLIFQPICGKRNSRIVAIVFISIYIIITGFPESLVRAGIMTILVLLSKIIYRKNDLPTSISISLLTILIINPFKIGEVGLQLSYIGTMGILLFQKTILKLLNKFQIRSKKVKYKIPKKLPKIFEKIKEIISVIFAAQIAILPLMLYHFNTFNPYFILTNFFISFIIPPIILLGIIYILAINILPQISLIIFNILKFLINILIKISEYSKNLPLSKIYFPTPKIWTIIIYYICILILIYLLKIKELKAIEKTGTQKRILNYIALFKYKMIELQPQIHYRKGKVININKKILASIFIICVIGVFAFIPRNLQIHIIDVGQGDSIFITTPTNKTVLIDGGGSTSAEYDVGKSVLIPYILDRGYTSIDYILISHFDQDHVGGIIEVIKELQVNCIIIAKQYEETDNYKEFINIAKEKNIKVKKVESGDKLNIEKDVFIDILWPDSDNVIKDNLINNNAIVCKLHYKDFSMLFTGDIEEIAEKSLIKKYKELHNLKGSMQNESVLKSDILKVAHHGSKSSSSLEFLELVKPQKAIISVGKNNMFGHPAEQTLENLKTLGVKVYRTDNNGEITIIVDGKSVKVSTMK